MKFHNRKAILDRLKYFVLVELVLSVLAMPLRGEEPHLQEEFIQIGENRIFTLHQGFPLESERSLITVLHGLPDRSHTQIRLMEALSQDYPLLAYDRLGLGLSDKPSSPYTIESQLEELRSVLTHFHIHQTVLLGHSFGGTLAVKYAALYPEQVKGIILINPLLIFQKDHTGLRDWNAWLMAQKGLGEMFMFFHNRFVTKMVLKRMIWNDAMITPALIDHFHAPMISPGAKAHFLGTLRSLYAMKEDELNQDLEAVQRAHIPALLLWTEKDRMMPVADSVTIANRMGALRKTIPQSGHLPQIELDDSHLRSELVQPIEDFLGGS